MNKIVKIKNIQNKIYLIRGIQVMLDSDLANLYGVETRVLNQAVKRNVARFPENFRFQITQEEYLFAFKSQNVIFEKDVQNLKSQSVISSPNHGGRRKLPYVFTEQGVAMLSAVLRSETAVKVSIQIMQAFVEMKKFISANANIFYRLETIEKRQIGYQIDTDKKFEQIFKALEDKSIKPKQGIFYNGQVFDAYLLITGIIKSARKSIILIDNYPDETVLAMLDKRKKN